MSYQGFSWSPYFDHAADHQRRNQPSEVNESYQRHSYQPTATHSSSVSSAPPQEYSFAQNSAERNQNSHSSRYGSQNYFDSRRLPPYSAAQTFINTTTAMGNLAYASSLAQRQTAQKPSSHVEVSTSNHQVTPTANSYVLPPYHHPIDSSRESETQNQPVMNSSHIFNHYEFQKRQAIAEASRKAAEEASAKAIKSAHVTTPAASSAPVPTPAAASAVKGSAANKKDQMELEMMQMIEKMRDYKARDPALFSQIWEQVKKGQPANQNQSANPNQSANSTPILAQMSLESDHSVDLKTKEPDLGKFPFHRRKPRKSTLMATDSSALSTTSGGSKSNGNKFVTDGTTSITNGKTSVTCDTTSITNRNTSIINGNTFFPNDNILSNNAHGKVSSNIESVDFNQKDANQKAISRPQQGRLSPQIVHVRGVGPQQELATSQHAPKKGTIWPEGSNKWALAEAARRALTSGSINAGRAISVNEIVKMLDQNPSYTELCEKLELRGFIIDRGHFARVLLSAISEVKTPAISEVKTPAIRSHGLPSPSEVISRSFTRNIQRTVPYEHPFPLNTPLLSASSKKEMAKKRTFAEVIDLTQHVLDEDEPIHSETIEKLSSQRDLLNSETIIRPMNKRNDALRRDRYNAKTIARDILVTSGKHPVMTSLNYHLDILRKKFRHVDNNSDLTTFKWDLIDPNDADDESAALNEVNADRQQVHIATAIDGNDVVMTDVNIRQPVEKFSSLDKFKASRYEGEDQGEMSFQRIPITATYHNVPNQREIFTPPSRPRGRPPGSGKKRSDERNEAAISSQTQFQSLSQPESQSPSQTPGSRRRGRPPGSKNRAPRESTTTSPHNGASTGPGSSTGPLRQSGLRNAMNSSDGFAVVIGSRLSATTSEQNKKGNREPKKTKSTRRGGVVHKVYKCRWNDCPYELHNLQTLRKHVYKHREQYAEGPFPCCWADCGTINLSHEDTDNDENALIPLEFNTVSAWEFHIDAKHLNIIAWDMGDGPSSSDVEASDYLSDTQGRQMTPVARTTGPPDPLGLTSGKDMVKEYHEVHGNRTDRDKAIALFESLKEKNTAQGGMVGSGSKVIIEDMTDKATVRSGFITVPPEEF